MRRKQIEFVPGNFTLNAVSDKFSKEEISNMLVSNLVMTCNVDKVIYKSVTNRGNMYVGEKTFVYQGFPSEERSRQMLQSWMNNHNAKYPYKAFQEIEYMKKEVMFSQLNPLTIKYVDGHLFNESEVELSQDIFDKENMLPQNAAKLLMEKELTKINEIEGACEKQVIFEKISTKCFVRTIKFSYVTKKNKRKEKVKSFITVDCTESSSQYNQIARDKEILLSCSVCSEKELANVKILSSSVSEIGALTIA